MHAPLQAMSCLGGSARVRWSEGLSGPTGGLAWHTRALRSLDRWEHFRQGVRGWLSTWNPHSEALILVGPSAGWTLPGDFLARFRHLYCIDIDPLARPLFHWVHGARLRMAGVDVRWVRADFMQSADALLRARPNAAVLLANMLGQHGFRSASASAAQDDIRRLQERLAPRSWASFHDRLSGAMSATTPLPNGFDHQGPISTEALARRVGRTGLWHDHLTADALPSQAARRLMPWRIHPTRVHWVEAGHGN